MVGLYFLFLLPQVSIPAWFTVDTRLGSLSVHLDTPQCFSAEMYSQELNIVDKPEDDKVSECIFISNCLFLVFLIYRYFPYFQVFGMLLSALLNGGPWRGGFWDNSHRKFVNRCSPWLHHRLPWHV